jgi:tRNA threonylcarbamoyladenosine biosynthesis protein TsaE
MSNCAASSAPARPPSCATCCARWRIKSPTYTVLEPYSLPGLEISHFDFYRFADPREWEDAGFREAFAAPGLKLVEWPQKAEPLLPLPDLRLLIEVIDDTRRRIALQAFTPRGVELIA